MHNDYKGFHLIFFDVQSLCFCMVFFLIATGKKAFAIMQTTG